jgi:hypothetical protein
VTSEKEDVTKKDYAFIFIDLVHIILFSAVLPGTYMRWDILVTNGKELRPGHL